MAVPDFQSLMLPVLKATADGEIGSADLRKRVAQAIGLTPEDLAEMLASGRQSRFTNRNSWATIFLRRAGLIERTQRGVNRITDEGRRALAENPSRIDMRYLERFPSYVEWRRRSNADTEAETGRSIAAGDSAVSASSSETPEEQIDRSHKALLAALETDLLDRILSMSPAFFENLIVELLIAMGYGGGRAEMGKAVGRAGDSGIDGTIKEDALGLDVVYMQAKRYAPENSIGRPEVQGFAGSLDGVRATKGIFITTSSFTANAREFADKISKRIILIDGAELARLMVSHNVGVRVRSTYEIKKVDEDYFSD